MTKARARAVLLVSCCAALSCVGAIPESSDPGRGGSDETPAGRSASPRGGAVPGAPGTVPGGGPAAGGGAGACAGAVDPGPAPMRRLTAEEYGRTVRDLLQTTTNPTASFPADSVFQGFSNYAELQTLSTAHAESYAAAAEQLAAAAMGAADRRLKIVGCDVAGAGRDACLKGFVERFGRRALRRPLAPVEVSDLLRVVAAGDSDPWSGPRLVIEALLQSPSFLFRPEVGVSDPRRPGVAQLNGYEVAARLSFLLWGTTPTDRLLDAAGGGQLDTPEGLERFAREMLVDPKAKEALRTFAGEWLRHRDLAGVTRDARKFPLWKDSLRTAMSEETLRLIDELAWRDGASFIDLLTTRVAFVNKELAPIYGTTAPDANLVRVDLGTSVKRSGLLTQASFLTIGSEHEAPSAIRRGKLIREMLLCETLPPPPPDVAGMTVPPKPGESEREYLVRHRAQPACQGCHALLEPLGFGLDEYDAIGAIRKTDANGKPVDPRGSLAGMESPDFSGAVELGQKLAAAAPRFAACMATQLFRFGFGRSELATDGCAIAQAQQAFMNGKGSVRELLLSYVRSDLFRLRQGGPS